MAYWVSAGLFIFHFSLRFKFQDSHARSGMISKAKRKKYFRTAQFSCELFCQNECALTGQCPGAPTGRSVRAVRQANTAPEAEPPTVGEFSTLPRTAAGPR